MARELPQLPRFEALIFDMDGVLIDSEPLHARAKREALLEAGIVVPEPLFAKYVGRSDKAMIYDLAAGHGFNEQRSAEILERKHRIYESLEETLKAIKEEGHVGVVMQPVGFLCDHVEILYDIDIAFREMASQLGLRLWRAESLNDSDVLAKALVEVVSGEYKATVDEITVPAAV